MFFPLKIANVVMVLSVDHMLVYNIYVFPLKIANVVMVLSVDHMLVYNIYVFSIENS